CLYPGSDWMSHAPYSHSPEACSRRVSMSAWQDRLLRSRCPLDTLRAYKTRRASFPPTNELLKHLGVSSRRGYTLQGCSAFESRLFRRSSTAAYRPPRSLGMCRGGAYESSHHN